MNIITRIKNNNEYARCRKLRDRALVEMKNHINDDDDFEFKAWSAIALVMIKRCYEIPLK